MSIKEALGRVQLDGEKTGGVSSQDSPRAYDKYGIIESSYKERVLKAGRSIHREAGVTRLLGELAEIIRLDFPDVRVHERLGGDGTVSARIEWNFQDIPRENRPPFNYEYNEVNVKAYPLTEDVVVWGKEEGELLTKDQWSSDPKLLEDAIVRAYHKPIRMAGPPGRF